MKSALTPRLAARSDSDDLSGNAWEITRSSLKANEVVVRGGNYYMGDITAGVANRHVIVTTQRDPLVGFRVCAAAPITKK